MQKVELNYKYSGQVAEIVLNDGKGNVLDSIMMKELNQVFVEFKKNPNIKIITIEGAGKHFSFGASVEEHTKDQVVGKDSEEKVKGGARHHDGDTAPHRLAVESTFQFMRLDFALALVQHLDITAKGNRGNHVLGLIRTRLVHPQGFAKADRKSQNLDAKPACYPEMAKFMHRNQYADGMGK